MYAQAYLTVLKHRQSTDEEHPKASKTLEIKPNILKSVVMFV